MIFGSILDRITPWLGRIALGLFVALAVIVALSYASCSRQEAAQSKQDARSATAGTKTAKEALTTQDDRHRANADLDAIAEKGKQDVRKAKEAGSDVGIDAAGRDTLCKLSKYRDHAACRVRTVHP